MISWLHGYFRGQGDIGGFSRLRVINGLGCRGRIGWGAISRSRGTVRIIILRWGWSIIWHRRSWRGWSIFWHCGSGWWRGWFWS